MDINTKAYIMKYDDYCRINTLLFYIVGDEDAKEKALEICLDREVEFMKMTEVIFDNKLGRFVPVNEGESIW